MGCLARWCRGSSIGRVGHGASGIPTLRKLRPKGHKFKASLRPCLKTWTKLSYQANHANCLSPEQSSGSLFHHSVGLACAMKITTDSFPLQKPISTIPLQNRCLLGPVSCTKLSPFLTHYIIVSPCLSNKDDSPSQDKAQVFPFLPSSSLLALRKAS